MLTKSLTTFSRYLLASLFIFSGFVKGIDPLGFTYKLSDYFVAFNLRFLEPLALWLSIALCAAELLIGLYLLFGVKLRTASWGAFLFMAIFTPLTFVIAILNPVSDCGCFGDAIKLSNWETFFKNIPLFLASWLLLAQRRNLTPAAGKPLEIFAAVLLIPVALFPSYHGYNHLPMVDFLPFSVGTSIPEAMSIPPNAPTDEYQTSLYYEKDGVVKEFNEHNFPWQDSTWRFVDSKSVLVKEGYRPPIKDFNLTNSLGYAVTDSIIHHNGYYLLAFSHRLDRVSNEAAENLNPLYFAAKQQGIGFALITASNPDEIDRFTGKYGAAYTILTADEIMIKTVIRANPGLMLLYNGTIIGKWHNNDWPDPTFFSGNLLAKQASAYRNHLENQRILTFSALILLMLLVHATAKGRPGKSK